MNSKISSDLKSKVNNNQLVDKIYSKLQSLESLEIEENNKPISKTDIAFLLENPQIKDVLIFCTENLNSKEEILKMKNKINFYSLNKESLEKIKLLKEKKEKMRNLIEDKKNKLSQIKQNKNQIIESKYQILDEISKKKKREELNSLKIKIIEQSKKKIEDMDKDFSMYSLIENYKHLNKINLVIHNENFSFDDFLEHNQKLFEQKINLEGGNKLPVVNLF
jgi:hypothetical protein